MPGATKTEIRLSGSGGQGILLAAALLADAALASGRRVVQTQSYGPEARGGASKAEVIISSEEIDYPEVRYPDITLCLSQAAFDKYAARNRPGSYIYFDSGLVRPSAIGGVELLGAPFTRLASEEIGRSMVTNIVALAALAAHTEVVSKEALVQALARRLPPKLLELNQRALELGFSTVLAATTGAPEPVSSASLDAGCGCDG
jgi:2-oxoglutarate ferredoxin oxidoreductase subunit gamma